eukprot:CAMPEP_0174918522 /NCGR_PEP_ID=MMETSP1355-20121228/3123_1 /TAXON_ID=464990 /ORGANISM="Hemiselmis tepida, Strain CCMP443" /LENGTH=44 /DNA_ID= /DNA_START= /DNA_END= /DNA_ORIENTATION=
MAASPSGARPTARPRKSLPAPHSTIMTDSSTFASRAGDLHLPTP